MDISIPAKGWYVEVDLPSGETVTPEVAGSPSRNPAVNDYPRLSIPVRKQEMWQNLDLKNNTIPVRVWYNAQRQPIDELEDIEESEGATQVLKGRGGTELENIYQNEVEAREAHLVAKDVIETATSYQANVDAPLAAVEENVQMQSVDTQLEWEDFFENSEPDNPIVAASDLSNGDGEGIVCAQTSFWQEAEDIGDSNVTFRGVDSNASAGEVVGLETAGDYVETGVQIEHTIPADQVGAAFRFRAPNSVDNVELEGGSQSLPGIDVSLDGQEILSYGQYAGVNSGYQWRDVTDWTDGDLQAGGHTIRVECSDSAPGTPVWDGWFDNTSNFDGDIQDERGADSVNVAVGAGGNGGDNAFSPPAIWVDPGTTVDWNWVDEDGYHNVVEENGEFDSGGPLQDDSYTYSYTFSDEGIYRYSCSNHGSDGGRGAVVVGTDYESVVDAEMYLDGFTLYDQRWHDDGAFSDSTNSNDALAYPADYPVGNGGKPIPTRTFEPVSRVRTIVGGRAEVAVDDASGIQEIALSNDSGQNYLRSGSGVDTFEGDFSGTGPSLKLQLTLKGFGSRSDVTPTEGFETPQVDAVVTKADLDDTPLVVDQRFDSPAKDVLSSIADELTDSLWVVRIRDDGTWSVEWAEPKQRTTDRQEPITSFESTSTVAEIVGEVTVKGSGQQVRGEEFVANHGAYVDLENDYVQRGKEVVYDPSTDEQFVDKRDYTVDGLNGRIQVQANGDMADGQTYQIDYQHQPTGTYTLPNAPATARTIKPEFPQLPTDRACGQVARLLGEELGDPLKEGIVTIPSDKAGWSVIEAVAFQELPFDEHLEVRDVENTPEQTVLRLGSRKTVSETLANIRSRIDALASRS